MPLNLNLDNEGDDTGTTEENNMMNLDDETQTRMKGELRRIELNYDAMASMPSIDPNASGFMQLNTYYYD